MTNQECRRHVLKDLRPYVCTYEDCTEADQQYDSIKDWMNHEVNAHQDTKSHPPYSSGQSSDGRGLGQLATPVTPNHTCRHECPICLEKSPSFSHVGAHLRRVAVFALPRSVAAKDGYSLDGTGSQCADEEIQKSAQTQITSASG